MTRRTHVLKCWPGPFNAVAAGAKQFEFRRDDRGFEVGDPTPGPICTLSGHHLPRGYTGRNLVRRVTYVLRGRFGVPDGFAVLSLEEIPTP